MYVCIGIKQLQFNRIKLEANNFWFCKKLFNYTILFALATFNASAGYMPVDTIISFTLCDYLFNKLQSYIIIKVLPWDG